MKQVLIYFLSQSVCTVLLSRKGTANYAMVQGRYREIDHNLDTIGDNGLFYEMSFLQVRLIQANLYRVRPQFNAS